MENRKDKVIQLFKTLQDDICKGLEDVDGGHFKQDLWNREGGGGGRTRVINGNIIEKGGVNFSAVHGKMPANIAAKLQLPENEFLATGVSIVLHPKSPHVPIIHMNVRYFETDKGHWWFGGGIDLTPHYIIPADAKYFHEQLKQTCDKHDPEFYPKFKTWADDYFYLKHRVETRGIGGIFFDRLSAEGKFEDYHAFTLDVGATFVPTYAELIKRNVGKPITEEDKHWQLMRRGRYVEFNLVWDKGTKFGLDTNGRTESILMSLPPQANWIYCHDYAKNEAAVYTQSMLKKGIDWVRV